MKKEWNTPSIETLEVSSTMEDVQPAFIIWCNDCKDFGWHFTGSKFCPKKGGNGGGGIGGSGS